MTQRTLLSLGSVNADFQVRVDDPPGSAETLLAHDQMRLSGGKAANVAYLGSTFGCRTVLLARVGADDLAEQALVPLREVGVDVSQVTQAEGQSTGVSMIMVPPDGKKHIVLATNANDEWDEETVQAMVTAIAQASSPALLVADYEVPAWVVRRAVEAAHRNAVPIVLDPSFPQRVEKELFGLLKAVSPNAAETEALTGRAIDSPEDAAQAARELCSAGIEIACIKLEDGGCVLGYDDTLTLIPACDVEVVDSTGGGDCFTGVLAIALLEGRAPPEAAALAVAAAGTAVTGYGSQPAYPLREDIEAMAARLLQLARPIDA